MGLESMGDRDDVKSLDVNKREALEQYEKSRKAYLSKDTSLTEEQRQKKLDAELDAKLKQFSDEEKESKKNQQESSEDEIASIEKGLNDMKDPEIGDLDFEFNDDIGWDSIDAIAKQSELYVNFNKKISEEYGKLSTSYNQLMQVVNRFNKEKENDTYFTGDDSYEKWVDEINRKIDHYKVIFKNAEEKITAAVNKSEAEGQKLDDAPDNLKRIEAEHLVKTEGQFQDQHQKHVEKLNNYGKHGQKLSQASQNLGQSKEFLNNYSNQLGQTSDVITNQKQQLDSQLSKWDAKKKYFQNIVKSVCVGVTAFSDQELKQLATNPEAFIQHQQSRERQQAAANLYTKYSQNLIEYLQIIDNYGTGVQQSKQLGQAKQEVTNRKTQVDQSTIQVTNQKTNVDNEINANNTRIDETKGEMTASEAQHIQSQEYYSGNIDNIDQLDSEISSIILDTSIQNNSNLQSLANFVQSFDGLKVSEKSWNEKLRDSTLGGIGKLLSDGLGRCKDKLFYFSDQIMAFGEAHPEIGNAWRFKVINSVEQFNIGIMGATLDLLGGIGTLVSNPMDTLGALGSLIGRDAITGERSLGAAGEARKNFGKAIINYDEFGEGNDARALGGAALNIASFFIPGAGEAGAAANTAKLAVKLGKVSKAKALLIGGYDFASRVGGKAQKIGKGLYKTIKNPSQAVEQGLGLVENTGKYLRSKATAPIKKVQNVASDLQNGGIGLALKNHIASTYVGKIISTLCWKEGKPLFSKKFPSLKEIPKTMAKMEERVSKLGGKGGELDKMFEKVKQYVTKEGELIPGREVPRREWGKIYDYQSGLQELKGLKNSIRRCRTIKTALNMEGKTGKLSRFIKQNSEFGKTLEKMIYNPEKAREIFAKFKRKNPKTDLSELDGTVLFRDRNFKFTVKKGGELEVIQTGTELSTELGYKNAILYSGKPEILKPQDVAEHFLGVSQDVEERA